MNRIFSNKIWSTINYFFFTFIAFYSCIYFRNSKSKNWGGIYALSLNAKKYEVGIPPCLITARLKTVVVLGLTAGDNNRDQFTLLLLEFSWAFIVLWFIVLLWLLLILLWLLFISCWSILFVCIFVSNSCSFLLFGFFCSFFSFCYCKGSKWKLLRLVGCESWKNESLRECVIILKRVDIIILIATRDEWWEKWNQEGQKGL